jgi:hypothetical protein
VEAASEQTSISRQLPVCSASPASTTNAAPHIRPCHPSLRTSIGFLSPHLFACSCPSQSVAKRHSNWRLTHTATSVAHSQGKVLSGQPVDLHSLPSQQPSQLRSPISIDLTSRVPPQPNVHSSTTTNMVSNDAPAETPKHSVLNSTFPVLLPQDELLHMPEDEFQAHVKKLLHHPSLKDLKDEIATMDDRESATVTGDEPVSGSLKRRASAEADNLRPQKAPFVAGLEQHAAHLRTFDHLAADNQALTENADMTNISSKNALVDLFYDLGENTESGKLKTLLEDAWNEDPLLTLKLIFNARSIHLGKSNRVSMYKAFGWLAENHPMTLLANLPWLVRPVIEKKAVKPDEKEKSKEADEDFDMVGAEEADASKAHDVKYGLSHGYWKDLLNLVVFAANDQLKFDGDPSSLLNQTRDESFAGKRKRVWDEKLAKGIRKRKKVEQNQRVQEKMRSDAFYRSLHITVSRLFAQALKEDKALLDSGHKSDLKKLSLAVSKPRCTNCM